MTTREGQSDLRYIEWLRVVLIVLVVAHHAAQPYGPTGGGWPVSDSVSEPLFGPFFTLNASFFMGFFFFLSGYFVEQSHERKGGPGFIRAKLIRLGIPLVLVSIFLFGLIAYSDSGFSGNYVSFLWYQYLGGGQLEMGPLWFIAQLLIYCLLFALWRALRPVRSSSIPALPGHRSILLYTLALAVAGIAVRTVYAQDEWIRIGALIPVEPVHLPQYISLFIIGIIAGRGRWLELLSPSMGYRWLLVGVAAFAAALVARQMPMLIPKSVNGQLLWGGLEAFVCVGFILGFLAIGRSIQPGTGWLKLSGCVYGVYLFHVFNVVGVQMAIIDYPLSAMLKFLIVTVLASAMTFASVWTLRLIPVVRKVL